MVARGYLQDCTDLEGLDERLVAGVVPAYIGYDATAQSLHVGHLLNIMMLRWLQKTGHRPITLMGGGTTKVGDPSFRSDERPLLTPAADRRQHRHDARRLRQVPRLRRRADRRDHARQRRVARRRSTTSRSCATSAGTSRSTGCCRSRASSRRLDRDQSLSFLEFNYMILQAYDFLELHRREGCLLQMGGSDQWGNIVNGIDLTRRVAGAEVFGLTSPLLTTSDGAKMGKTAGGAVWLNAETLAPYDFWQFWRNTADADVGRFLKLYTELPVEECDRLGALGGAEINAAKIIAGERGHHALPRRRGGRRRRGDRPRGLRGGRHRRRPADADAGAGATSRRAASRSCSSWSAPASPAPARTPAG